MQAKQCLVNQSIFFVPSSSLGSLEWKALSEVSQLLIDFFLNERLKAEWKTSKAEAGNELSFIPSLNLFIASAVLNYVTLYSVKNTEF